MGKRRKGRELLVQAIYAASLSGGGLQDCVDDQIERRQASAETAAFVRPLADLIERHRDELDASLDVLLENWDPARVGQVERAIFRLALAELRFCADVPVSVVLNEACELARLFGDEGTVQFVNGLLDRAARTARPGAPAGPGENDKP
ncbi:transcription antitermination factor NusB [bacterium]|nr:transcription antitermination factor NusB [bacterium]MBU1072495.1 transcription antitermination factor NusB [bacterium]MBU1675329.1 transcription antitermination factor NusB [bacterium]